MIGSKRIPLPDAQITAECGHMLSPITPRSIKCLARVDKSVSVCQNGEVGFP
jgi:hypothetical protein